MTRLVVALLLLLILPALAQTAAQGAYLTKMEALARQGDIIGMAELTQADPGTARTSCLILVQALQGAGPEDQKVGMVILRVIARTFELRLNDPSLTQMMDNAMGPVAESTWAGTALARGGAPAPPASAPGQATTLDRLLVLMRFGNFLDASKLAPPNSRFAAACELGMGRPVEALARAEKLLAGPLPAEEQLPTRLLAVHAAYMANLAPRYLEHLRKLEAMDLPPGRYGEVAGFLRDTYRLDLDLVKNVDMPLTEIFSRHDRAWARLQTLPQATEAELAGLSSELFWVCDVYWRTWFLEVGSLKGTADPTSTDPLLKKVGPTLVADLKFMIEASGPLLKRNHAELFFGSIDVLERYAHAFMGPSPEQVTNAEKNLQMIEGRVKPAYEMAKNATPVPGVTLTRGALSNAMAGLFLLKADLILKRSNNQPTDEQIAEFRSLLAQARPYVSEADNVDTWESLLILDLEMLLEAQPPGWAEAAEKDLAEYRQVTGELKTRNAQFNYHFRRGKLLVQQKRRAEGAAALQQAVDVLESSLREFGGGSRLMQANRTINRHVYEALARAQVQEGKNQDAFQTVTRLQQLESAGTFTVNDLKERVKPGDQGLVLRAEESQQKLQAAEQEVAVLTSQGAAPAQVAKANQVLADSRKSYFAVVTELEKKYPEFEKLDVKPINFAKLQRSIPQDTLVVLYFPTAEEVFLMEATSTNLTVRRVNQGRTQLNRMVADWRKATLARQAPPRELYDALVAPLEADLKGKTTLAVIPYGSLMYVPFAALAPANGPYLIEGKRVVTLCKATDLDQVFGPPSAKTGGLVAFGNPDGTLPAAGQEVKALGTLFPGSKVYVEGQATNARLEGVHAPETSYLHLATHGVLDSRDPRSSYLKLAGGQKLSVTDITSTRLDGPKGDLNLVTLSACQTALGERDPDGSDLRSLADAFSFAGCRSMVASLWSVNDESTKLLMTEFYKGLKAGKSKAEALQAAQVAMLKQPTYANPFYWAPFVLIGDWR